MFGITRIKGSGLRRMLALCAAMLGLLVPQASHAAVGGRLGTMMTAGSTNDCLNSLTCSVFLPPSVVDLPSCIPQLATKDGIDASVLDVTGLPSTTASQTYVGSTLTPAVQEVIQAPSPGFNVYFRNASCGHLGLERYSFHFGDRFVIAVPRGTKWMVGFYNAAPYAKKTTWKVCFGPNPAVAPAMSACTYPASAIPSIPSP